VAYAEEVLKNDRFEFNTDERIQIDRRKAPYPQDLEEARHSAATAALRIPGGKACADRPKAADTPR